jgi:hypothetical protein
MRSLLIARLAASIGMSEALQLAELAARLAR